MCKIIIVLMVRIEPFEKYSGQYEAWFDTNAPVYQSELKALRKLLPRSRNSVEIGVGSGRFAVPLGIRRGLEPSASMARIAQQRGIRVDQGICERLPYEDSQFDLVLMVTTLCFLDDVVQSFREVHRILMKSGWLVIGFIDKNSSLGKLYREYSNTNVFYSVADFYSLEEITRLLLQNGFGHLQFVHTISRPVEDIDDTEPALEGYGTGSFVVIRAMKQVI